MEVFSSEDTRKVLWKKFVVVIGDSVQRCVYKDLVCLLAPNSNTTYVRPSELKAKGEFEFLGDKLLQGGKLSDVKSGVKYREVRQYDSGSTLVKFYFVTRCYSDHVMSVLNELKAIQPHVVIMNSCLWDLHRYGPCTPDDYQCNMTKLMHEVKRVIPDDSVFIWNATMPLASKCKGGFFLPFYDSLPSQEILGANRIAGDIVRSFRFVFLDLHSIFLYQLHLRAEDGIHWNSIAHRRISNLILHQLCRMWNLPVPIRMLSEPVQLPSPHFGPRPLSRSFSVNSNLDRIHNTNEFSSSVNDKRYVVERSQDEEELAINNRNRFRLISSPIPKPITPTSIRTNNSFGSNEKAITQSPHYTSTPLEPTFKTPTQDSSPSYLSGASPCLPTSRSLPLMNASHPSAGLSASRTTNSSNVTSTTEASVSSVKGQSSGIAMSESPKLSTSENASAPIVQLFPEESLLAQKDARSQDTTPTSEGPEVVVSSVKDSIVQETSSNVKATPCLAESAIISSSPLQNQPDTSFPNSPSGPADKFSLYTEQPWFIEKKPVLYDNAESAIISSSPLQNQPDTSFSNSQSGPADKFSLYTEQPWFIEKKPVLYDNAESAIISSSPLQNQPDTSFPNSQSGPADKFSVYTEKPWFIEKKPVLYDHGLAIVTSLDEDGCSKHTSTDEGLVTSLLDHQSISASTSSIQEVQSLDDSSYSLIDMDVSAIEGDELLPTATETPLSQLKTPCDTDISGLTPKCISPLVASEPGVNVVTSYPSSDETPLSAVVPPQSQATFSQSESAPSSKAPPRKRLCNSSDEDSSVKKLREKALLSQQHNREHKSGKRAREDDRVSSSSDVYRTSTKRRRRESEESYSSKKEEYSVRESRSKSSSTSSRSRHSRHHSRSSSRDRSSRKNMKAEPRVKDSETSRGSNRKGSESSDYSYSKRYSKEDSKSDTNSNRKSSDTSENSYSKNYSNNDSKTGKDSNRKSSDTSDYSYSKRHSKDDGKFGKDSSRKSSDTSENSYSKKHSKDDNKSSHSRDQSLSTREKTTTQSISDEMSRKRKNSEGTQPLKYQKNNRAQHSTSHNDSNSHSNYSYSDTKHSKEETNSVSLHGKTSSLNNTNQCSNTCKSQSTSHKSNNSSSALCNRNKASSLSDRTSSNPSLTSRTSSNPSLTSRTSSNPSLTSRTSSNASLTSRTSSNASQSEFRVPKIPVVSRQHQRSVSVDSSIPVISVGNPVVSRTARSFINTGTFPTFSTTGTPAYRIGNSIMNTTGNPMCQTARQGNTTGNSVVHAQLAQQQMLFNMSLHRRRSYPPGNPYANFYNGYYSNQRY